MRYGFRRSPEPLYPNGDSGVFDTRTHSDLRLLVELIFILRGSYRFRGAYICHPMRQDCVVRLDCRS